MMRPGFLKKMKKGKFKDCFACFCDATETRVLLRTQGINHSNVIGRAPYKNSGQVLS